MTLLAVGLALAARIPRRATTSRRASTADADPPPDRRPATLRRRLARHRPRQFLAGLLFGLACTARLTVVFGAPFFLLVGGGGGWWRRGLSAGLGAAIPIGAPARLQLVTTGHSSTRPTSTSTSSRRGYPALGYHPDWAIEDPRYLPQNLAIMLLLDARHLARPHPGRARAIGDPLCSTPGAARGLFDRACPLAVPRDIGMSVLLTSPAYLLAAPGARGATAAPAGDRGGARGRR